MTILLISHGQNVVHDKLCRKKSSSPQLKGQSPLVLVCNIMDMGLCHFPIGILGQVWYLIVSIPDLCNLTYLQIVYMMILTLLNLIYRTAKKKQRF